MHIRLAIKRDLPAINRIYNQAVARGSCTAHLEPRSMDEQLEWFMDHDPDRFPVFVAEDERVVTGWVSLGAYRKGRQALARVAEVSYYVDERKRNRGIGSALLEHALVAAPRFGFRVLIAILLSGNKASIGLLDKYGFTAWGRMPSVAQIEGRLADHLYYGLHLEPFAGSAPG